MIGTTARDGPNTVEFAARRQRGGHPPQARSRESGVFEAERGRPGGGRPTKDTVARWPQTGSRGCRRRGARGWYLTCVSSSWWPSMSDTNAVTLASLSGLPPNLQAGRRVERRANGKSVRQPEVDARAGGPLEVDAYPNSTTCGWRRSTSASVTIAALDKLLPSNLAMARTNAPGRCGSLRRPPNAWG